MLMRALFRSETTRLLLIGFIIGTTGVALTGPANGLAHTTTQATVLESAR